MSDENSGIDLSEPEEKKGFPWLVLGMILAVFALAAVWVLHGKSSGSRAEVAALELELKKDKETLEEEHDKVFQLTEQLNALKQAIARRQIKDHENAVAEYNTLAAQQRAQREKVKDLAEQFNAKLARVNELQ